MTPTRAALGLLAAMALGSMAAAQTAPQPPTASAQVARPNAEPNTGPIGQSAAAPSCATEHAWLETEVTTPGILQVLAREALSLCIAGAARAPNLAVAPR
jgi:hypothetical protein